MKCPYCHEEMEVGLLRNGNPLTWYATPGDCEIPYHIRRPSNQKVPRVQRHALPTHYCKYCGLLLAESVLEPRGLEHSIARRKAQARTLYKKLKKEDF